MCIFDSKLTFWESLVSITNVSLPTMDVIFSLKLHRSSGVHTEAVAMQQSGSCQAGVMKYSAYNEERKRLTGLQLAIILPPRFTWNWIASSSVGLQCLPTLRSLQTLRTLRSLQTLRTLRRLQKAFGSLPPWVKQVLQAERLQWRQPVVASASTYVWTSSLRRAPYTVTCRRNLQKC